MSKFKDTLATERQMAFVRDLVARTSGTFGEDTQRLIDEVRDGRWLTRTNASWLINKIKEDER